MKSQITLRVRYEETDAMGVVYHGNYFTWFEIGRTELLRDYSMSYKEMENKKCFLPVIEATCRYKSSACYDDEVIIETELHPTTDLYFDFTYVVLRKSDQKLLAEGETKHVCVGENGRILTKATKSIKQQLFKEN